MSKFNVLIYDINHNKPVPYNIIPYFIREYNWEVEMYNKYHDRIIPITFEEFKTFIEYKSKYQFWSRCEYEFIISSWPPNKSNEYDYKIDVYEQIMMNIDIITKLVIEEISNNL